MVTSVLLGKEGKQKEWRNELLKYDVTFGSQIQHGCRCVWKHALLITTGFVETSA
jgi:hypothetical protein